jgi:hypothetical protein
MSPSVPKVHLQPGLPSDSGTYLIDSMLATDPEVVNNMVLSCFHDRTWKMDNYSSNVEKNKVKVHGDGIGVEVAYRLASRRLHPA